MIFEGMKEGVREVYAYRVAQNQNELCSIYSVALQNLMRVYRKRRKSFRGDAENTQDAEKARK